MEPFEPPGLAAVDRAEVSRDWWIELLGADGPATEGLVRGHKGAARGQLGTDPDVVSGEQAAVDGAGGATLRGGELGSVRAYDRQGVARG